MRAALLLLTLLAPASATNPLGVTLEIAPGGAADHHFLNYRLSLDISELTFVPDGDVRRADFVMHFDLVPRGPRGRVIPLETRKQTLTVTEAELQDPNTDFMSFAWQLDLSPVRVPDHLRKSRERMRLRITVEDPASGRRSVVTAPLFHKRPRLFTGQ